MPDTYDRIADHQEALPANFLPCCHRACKRRPGVRAVFSRRSKWLFHPRNWPRSKKDQTKPIMYKPIYFNDLPGIVRCVPFVHQADRRARTVGTATFAKGPAPSRGRGREPDGDEIVANGFAIRENDLPKTDTKRSQFSYRASFFNHLEEISEAKNRRRSGAKPAPRLFVHRIGGPARSGPGPAAAKPI